MIKIAFIDNMNNFGFSVVRYLRDKGYNADLLILSHEYDHFKPEADSYNDEYKDFVKYLGWNEQGVVRTSSSKVEKEMKEYDVIIGSGYAPAYLNKAGIKLDIFIPHGSDLYHYPFKYKGLPFSKRKIVQYFVSNWQKKGIENASYIFLDITNNDLEAEFSKFNLKGIRIKKACPFIYLPQYCKDEMQEYTKSSEAYRFFKKIRDEFEFVIFHHSGHQWSNPLYYYAQKRNDILIRAFASFCKANPACKSCLILFEYGPDVDKSKELIKALDIEENVMWSKKMCRKDIMIGIAMCDLGAGEFGHSWFSYGVIYEFLAMNKPVMHYREDSLYKEDYPEMYPMYSAKNEVQILNVLNRYLNDKTEFIQTGLCSGHWFRKYAVEEPVNIISALIEDKIKLRIK